MRLKMQQKAIFVTIEPASIIHHSKPTVMSNMILKRRTYFHLEVLYCVHYACATQLMSIQDKNISTDLKD